MRQDPFHHVRALRPDLDDGGGTAVVGADASAADVAAEVI